jgi:hypothetical protein
VRFNIEFAKKCGLKTRVGLSSSRTFRAFSGVESFVDPGLPVFIHSLEPSLTIPFDSSTMSSYPSVFGVATTELDPHIRDARNTVEAVEKTVKIVKAELSTFETARDLARSIRALADDEGTDERERRWMIVAAKNLLRKYVPSADGPRELLEFCDDYREPVELDARGDDDRAESESEGDRWTESESESESESGDGDGDAVEIDDESKKHAFSIYHLAMDMIGRPIRSEEFAALCGRIGDMRRRANGGISVFRPIAESERKLVVRAILSAFPECI